MGIKSFFKNCDTSLFSGLIRWCLVFSTRWCWSTSFYFYFLFYLYCWNFWSLCGTIPSAMEHVLFSLRRWASLLWWSHFNLRAPTPVKNGGWWGSRLMGSKHYYFRWYLQLDAVSNVVVSEVFQVPPWGSTALGEGG